MTSISILRFGPVTSISARTFRILELNTQDGILWFRAGVRKNDDDMEKGEIELLETGTISDERCYALFANVIIDTNAGAERLLKEHGLIAKDASVRISKVHTGDAQKHTRVTFIEYKVMERDMHDG